MEKYSRENLIRIQNMVQAKTGVDFAAAPKPAWYKIRQTAILACCFMCFVSLSAFAYARFSGLNGDEAGFAAVYQGNGQFALVVENYSDVELTLQNKVRLMQWSTSREASNHWESGP